MSQCTNFIPVMSKRGTISPFLSLVLLFLVLPGNFIVLYVKIKKKCCLTLNVILFSILWIYILLAGYYQSVTVAS